MLDAWKIFCTSAQFQSLRADAAFHRLIDLGRHANALRYGISAVGAVGGKDTPNASRQRSGTFFYLGGVLFEAFALIPDLRPHFGGLRSWQAGFGRFGSDEDIRSRLAQKGDLHRLRNHTAFHVLKIVAERSLPSLEMDEYVFTTGLGDRGAEIYHNLSDTVGLHYAIHAPSNHTEFMAEFERLASETRDLAIEYLSASDKLIGAALRNFGFRKAPV